MRYTIESQITVPSRTYAVVRYDRAQSPLTVCVLGAQDQEPTHTAVNANFEDLADAVTYMANHAAAFVRNAARYERMMALASR